MERNCNALAIAEMKYKDQKQHWGQKICFTLEFLGSIASLSKPGQESAGRNWKRLWRSTAYWLALFGLLSLLSYTPQDHQPGVAPFTSIINQLSKESYLQANFMEAFSWLRFFFPVVTLPWVNLT